MQVIVSGSLANLIAPFDRLVEGGLEPLGEALQKGGEKTRTQMRRALKGQTNVKTYGTIVAHVTGKRAGLAYTITGRGKGLPIREFPVRVSRSRRQWVRWSPREHWRLQKRNASGQFGALPDISEAGEVNAVPWGVGRTFKRSFAMPDGRLRQAVKGGKRGWKLHALFGPSIAKEIVKDEALATFYRSVETDIVPAVERRLMSLLR